MTKRTKNSKSPKEKRPQMPKDSVLDVLGTAEKLAEILNSDPKALDQDSYRRGDRFLAIFSDPNYGRGLPNLSQTKIEVVKQALDDLSGRGKVLSTAYIGVIFYENQIQTFVSSYDEAPTGSMVYKIGIKNVASFQNWRNGANDEISQDDLNSAIYRLTAEWAFLL